MLNKRKVNTKHGIAVLRNQKGIALLEVVVAIALLGIVVVAILLGLSTSFKSSVLANNQAKAISLAQQQADSISAEPYNASGYSAIIPEYPNFFITVHPPTLIGATLQEIKIDILMTNRVDPIYSIVYYKVQL